jgi:hypothetical protein
MIEKYEWWITWLKTQCRGRGEVGWGEVGYFKYCGLVKKGGLRVKRLNFMRWK